MAYEWSRTPHNRKPLKIQFILLECFELFISWHPVQYWGLRAAKVSSFNQSTQTNFTPIVEYQTWTWTEAKANCWARSCSSTCYNKSTPLIHCLFQTTRSFILVLYKNPYRTNSYTSSEVSHRFKIALSNLTGWKANESILIQSIRIQRDMWINQLRQWSEMEIILYQQFVERRKGGKVVQRGWFVRKSAEIVIKTHPDTRTLFHFSNG